MKKLVLSIIAISINLLNAQTTCLEEGIIFTTQSQIDSFPINYPDCTKILGSVSIGHFNYDGYEINNLTGLNSIQVIGGNLNIINTDSLQNLDGLESLDSIGTIGFIINDIEWFGSLRLGTVFAGVGRPNDSLSNIDGLSNLTYVGGSVFISCNPLLENLDGLNNLTLIGRSLRIASGENGPYPGEPELLENIEGLSNLTSINGYVHIEGFDSLTSLQGLQNIDPQGISSLSIAGNLNLSECEVASVCTHLLNGGENDILDNTLGCNSEEEVLLACASVGISEINHKKPFSIYPNPNSGLINIDLENLSDVSIKVLNLNGQLVYAKESINSPLFQFDLDAAPGIYILEVSTANQKQSFKLIKQ